MGSLTHESSFMTSMSPTYLLIRLILKLFNMLCEVMSSKYTQRNPCNAVLQWFFFFLLKTKKDRIKKER